MSSSYSEVSKSSAYQFTTDSSGKISIAKINKANYVAYEVDPPAGYIVTNTSGITMKQNGITKISNKPKPQGFSIIIRKYDSSTGSGLANAYFKFKDTKTGKYLSSSKTLVVRVKLVSLEQIVMVKQFGQCSGRNLCSL